MKNLKYLAALLVVISILLALAWDYHKGSIFPDRGAYEALYQDYFSKAKGVDCAYFGRDRLEWMRRTMKDVEGFEAPKEKAVYLKDKLRYYDEIAYRHKSSIAYLIEDAKRELQKCQEGEMTPKSPFFERNREYYLREMGRLFPLYERLALFNDEKLERDRALGITRDYWAQFQGAVEACQKIRQENDHGPSILYILDGGSGKDVPLDDYETRVLERLIEERVGEGDWQGASERFIALITFQIEETNVYLDRAKETLEQYADFLKKSPLSPRDELVRLREEIKNLRRPDSDERKIKAQERHIKRVGELIESL